MSKILYIEDEESFSKTITSVLKLNNHKVTPIYDGNKAVYSFMHEKPDLVIMDICLDNSPDGFELARQIKSFGNVPIIFTSALSREEVNLEYNQFNNVEYMEKPFRYKELLQTIKQYTEKKSYFYDQCITKLGNTEFNFEESYMIVNNHMVHLGPKECQVMQLFVERFNRYVSKACLLDKVWDDQVQSNEQSLYNIITKLKKLLEPDKSLKIKNIIKVGWKLST